jgi:hypothetical protein
LPATKELPSTESVEKEIDVCCRRDIERVLSKARQLLATKNSDTDQFDEVLIGYPDAEECKARNLLVSARLGHDHRIRFTPIKVIALTLMDRTAAVYEGALDLTTGEILSERLLELPYQNITLLERSSRTMRHDSDRDPKRPLRAARRHSNGQFNRDNDALKIHLSNSSGVEIILRDYDFDPNLKATKLPLSSLHEDVERFWSKLGQKWSKAQNKMDS